MMTKERKSVDALTIDEALAEFEALLERERNDEELSAGDYDRWDLLRDKIAEGFEYGEEN